MKGRADMATAPQVALAAPDAEAEAPATAEQLAAQLCAANESLAALTDERRELRAELAEERKRHERSQQDVEFHRDVVNALEKRLERMKGYLDRVLEREDMADGPQSFTTAAPLPSKGPPLNDIPLPTRPTAGRDERFNFASLANDDDRPRRRY